MTDDLRTRIAAVLDKHYPQTTGYHDELTDWCQCGMPRSHVVDVLIRELGRQMPDSPRIRIAEAISEQFRDLPRDMPWSACLVAADAVIRELKLEREDGECLYCHAQLPCGRWVAWDE